MIRIFLACLGLVTVLVVGCSSGRPEVVARSDDHRRSLPAASGPVIRPYSPNYPFTIQAVQASTAPQWAGRPAPAGERFLLVTVEIRGVLRDRATPAMAPRLEVRYPGCKRWCAGSVDQETEYLTREQAEDPAYHPREVDRQFLDPGVPYYTTLGFSLREGVDLNDVQLCAFTGIGAPDRCLSVKAIPRA